MGIPFLGYAIKNLLSKPSTEKYPFVKRDAPEGYRGKINFHPDRCVACSMCINVCSPGAITMTHGEKTGEGEKITMEFNLNSCTFCQMCADFCPRKAIEMTGEYSMVAENKDDLIVGGSFVKKIPQKPAQKKEPSQEECK
jgi:Formate hydrogenlyase subunit 6/NADH:ubiquinone oxidoreductase 23 kD subunit (chain I)